MALLCNLEVKEACVLDAYVTTPNREKIWAVSSKFGDDDYSLRVILSKECGCLIENKSCTMYV